MGGSTTTVAERATLAAGKRCGTCGYLAASCPGHGMTRATDLLQTQFTIDPRAKDFRALQSVCEEGNPFRCLIGTMGSIQVGKRLSAHVNHDEHTGAIRLTHGDCRWERPMTEAELNLATRFDMHEEISEPVTVVIDLADGQWTSRPKAKSRGGVKTAANNHGRGPGNRRIKSIRERQLDAIRKTHSMQPLPA